MIDTKKQMFASNEVMGAVLTKDLNSGDARAFGADPKGFIYSATNIDIGAGEFSVVENSGNTINLALPYYSVVEQFSAQVLDESGLDDVSGGEILISLFIAAGIGAGVGAGIAAGVATSTLAIVGGVVGGAIGVATTVAVGTGIAIAANESEKGDKSK